MYRRVFVQSVAASAMWCAGSAAARAQSGMPLRVVFPFPAGGSGGALARMVADWLAAGTGQPAIVENKPGAGGRIGVQMVRNAAPDGMTLLVSPIAPMAVYQHVYKSLGYDPLADFRPVTQLATFEFGLAVGAGVPARTVAELVAWVKANPERANYGSPAPGTLPHFLGVWFGQSVGIDWRHIGYGATARPINDLVSGHIPIVFYSTNELVELHKAGRIRVLATSSGGAFSLPARRADVPRSRLRHRGDRLVRPVCAGRDAGCDRRPAQPHDRGGASIGGCQGQDTGVGPERHRDQRRGVRPPPASRRRPMGAGRARLRLHGRTVATTPRRRP